MKHTSCFESRFYRGWILLVVLLSIGISAQMGIASKGGPTLSKTPKILPLSEKSLGSSFRLISALGTQTLPTEQSEILAIKEHPEPLNPEPTKSPTKAFLYSALVPGSGQLYIGGEAWLSSNCGGGGVSCRLFYHTQQRPKPPGGLSRTGEKPRYF